MSGPTSVPVVTKEMIRNERLRESSAGLRRMLRGQRLKHIIGRLVQNYCTLDS